MAGTHQVSPGSSRLSWIDITKAISILWIVLFHFFSAYDSGRYPSLLQAGFWSTLTAGFSSASMLSSIETVGADLFSAVVNLGFHAVGVFLLLSGFGLTYSLTKTGGPKVGWWAWYRKRLLRLFPMYWTAHLIYLVSPFVARPEPIDYRFLLSFLGDRVYPLNMIFFYANPAWWFFGLLIELYLVFPLLFRLLQRVGAGWFLVVCAILTFVSRYVMLCVLQLDGNYVQGALFLGRLWEFAAGMALAFIYRQSPGTVYERLFSRQALVAGCVMYALGLATYGSLLALYTFTDALIGTGLFIILAYVARWYSTIPVFGKLMTQIGAYSYGLYLLHQPYVLYFGERLRGLSLPVFLIVALGIIAAITSLAIPLEQYVNRLSSWVLDRGGQPGPAPVASEAKG